MVMLPLLLLIHCLTLDSIASLTIDSAIVTQVNDPGAGAVIDNSYIVYSRTSNEAFFVDTGATDNGTARLISLYQQQVQSTTKPPKFIFITHGHYDHLAGIGQIRRVYPTVPVYVMSEQVVKEALRFINSSCTLRWLNAAQCAVDYRSILKPVRSPRNELSIGDSSLKVRVLNVLIKGETSYAGFLGVTTSSGAYLLFTGDAIIFQSHLYVTNPFEANTLPSSDDNLCAWAGMIQSTMCSLQGGTSQPKVFPGHGPVAEVADYQRHFKRNIEWLRLLRNLTFNSCNATYVWGELVRQFPDFGLKEIDKIGTLTAHVPADANSMNCNCNDGVPTICPRYNPPPTCMHLDITDDETVLACDMISLKSAARSHAMATGQPMRHTWSVPAVLLISWVFGMIIRE